MSYIYNLDQEVDLDTTVDLLEKFYDLVIAVDKESRIIYVNESFEKLVAAGNLLGEEVSKIEPASKFLRVLREGKPLFRQRQLIETAGLEMIVSYFPVKRNEKVQGAVGVGRLIAADNIYRILLNGGMQKPAKDSYSLKKNLPEPFRKLTGLAPSFIKVLNQGAAAAGSDVNVLLLGESGTGKEIFSRAVHYSGGKENQPFVVFNCAAVPEHLLESELFGYVPGAFTGASASGKAGKLEEAHGGTLFLDEIGDLPQGLQAKMLRVLQFKTFEKVGSTTPMQVDARIIAATNKDLWGMVKEGKFREDLYYRLNVFPIKIPSLRERKVDIKELSQLFLNHLSSKYQCYLTLDLTEEVEQNLMWYHWPGNVRELENVIEHAFVMALSEESNILLLRHLPVYLQETVPEQERFYFQGKNDGEGSLSLKEVVEKYELNLIIQLLQRHNNNKSAVIEKLGISKGAFYHKLNKYDLL